MYQRRSTGAAFSPRRVLGPKRRVQQQRVTPGVLLRAGNCEALPSLLSDQFPGLRCVPVVMPQICDVLELLLLLRLDQSPASLKHGLKSLRLLGLSERQAMLLLKSGQGARRCSLEAAGRGVQDLVEGIVLLVLHQISVVPLDLL